MRLSALLLLVASASLLMAQGPSAPVNLRVEYLVDPPAIDVEKPRFYWTPVHTARGAEQAAYQVVVSSKPAAPDGDVWDSGKVASKEFTHIEYNGRQLESGRTYYWKVRYWDAQDKPSAYSQAARFGTGLLKATDWKGKWIAGGNQLRKEFTLAAAPVRARAYVTGLGYYELRLNGHKVGNHVLDPGWTAYDKRVYYETYDVTSLLQAGPNAVGMMLGEGWYGGRVALLQLNIELPGGKVQEIVTDTTWKATQGPIVSDSIYHGETYDATKETGGWDRAGFDDAAWKPATLANPAPTGVLSAQMMPAIRVTGEIIPLKVTSPRPGVFVYDFGQNFSGWVRLRVRGPRGTTVRIRHSELLYDDGTLNTENLRSARATDIYTLRGSGKDEIYEPRFTYHGFRYAELTGYPGAPRVDSVVARVVHTDVKPNGGFVASKALLNQVQRLILWGTTANLHSVPTDCNQRDERMGWMADAHLNAETAMYNFDMAAFFSMWLRNMRDNQAEDGSVPDTVPRARFARGPADPAWGAAYPIILWYMYQHYGDRRLLEQNFDGIRRWADFLTSRSENGVLNFVKFGDWVPVMPTPGNLVSTAYWYWSVDTVARAAAVLGKSAEADKYRAQGEEIKAAFHKRFYNADNRNYGNGSQTSNLLPLFLNMAPKEAVGPVRGFLRNDIVYTHNTHLTTGILGTKYLLPYLARTGNADLAYELATQTSYPSWGYMIERGATTLWELWQEKTGPSMNSHNHPMFGSVGAYYYSTLAGIGNAADSVGYQKLRIAPTIVRDLQWVSGTFDTVRGPVAVDWRRSPEQLQVKVTVPFGSTADVVLPKLGMREAALTESGKPVADAKQTDNDVTIHVGAGTYNFELLGVR